MAATTGTPPGGTTGTSIGKPGATKVTDSSRDKHDGNRIAPDRLQHVVEEGCVLTLPGRAQHVVDDAGHGHLALEPIDGEIELRAALLDVSLQVLQVLCHPVTLSESTSASRLSERMVRCGVNVDADMACRP